LRVLAAFAHFSVLSLRRKIMGEPRTVPAIFLSEEEESLSGALPGTLSPTNLPSTSANSGESSDPDVEALSPQVGVDLPGVGHVFPGRQNGVDASDELPQTLRDYLDGKIPDNRNDKSAEARETLKAERDVLLAQLLFAARDLANRAIRTLRMPRTDDSGNGEISICRECNEVVNGVAPLRHKSTCRVVRVRRILDDLVELANPANQAATNDKKEGAPEGESADAGDGIRLRGEKSSLVGSIGRACGRCGGRFGIWSAVQRPEAEVELRSLGPNQCVEAGVDGHGHTLYTHYCDGIDYRESLSLLEDGAE
jgi:hypothetical protein